MARGLIKGIDREVLPQEFTNFRISVPSASPIQLSAVAQNLESQLYDSMILSVHSSLADGVYLGGPNVTNGPTTNGLQIRPGVPIQLSIAQRTPQYELQVPLIDGLNCVDSPRVGIPVVVWDVNNIWLRADTNGRNVAVLLFRVPWL